MVGSHLRNVVIKFVHMLVIVNPQVHSKAYMVFARFVIITNNTLINTYQVGAKVKMVDIKNRNR